MKTPFVSFKRCGGCLVFEVSFNDPFKLYTVDVCVQDDEAVGEEFGDDGAVADIVIQILQFIFALGEFRELAVVQASVTTIIRIGARGLFPTIERKIICVIGQMVPHDQRLRIRLPGLDRIMVKDSRNTSFRKD